MSAFLLLSSQWRRRPDGAVEGLDKSDLTGILDDLEVEKPEDRLQVRVDLMEMEATVVEELSRSAPPKR